MSRKMIVSLVLVLLVGLGCSSSSPTEPPPPPPGDVTVQMMAGSFTPKTLTIDAGTRVTWTNSSSLPHTTTSGTNGMPDGRWDSGTLNNGESFSRTFNTPGTYPYYCTFHWPAGMTGTVVVNP